MLSNTQDKQKATLVVAPVPIEVSIGEAGGSTGLFLFPPLEDLLEMQSLASVQVSVREWSASFEKRVKEDAEYELLRLQEKREKFSRSSTYFNRLANLASLARNYELEKKFLDEAKTVSDDIFFDRSLGENQISRNELSDAEMTFSLPRLANDIHSNLRLAYLHVLRGKVFLARPFVEAAISIDDEDFSSRLFEGALNLAESRFEEAISSFRVAASIRNNSSALHMNMAVAYLFLKQNKKALGALRRAVAFDPLNTNAVVLLGDLAFSEGCNEDAIPSLRYFVQFEQKIPAVWERLARALIEIENHNEAIAALRRQGALGESSSIWNNIGVANCRIGEIETATRAFAHAMRLAHDTSSSDAMLACRNLSVVFTSAKRLSELYALTSYAMSHFDLKIIARSPVLSILISNHIHALILRKNYSEAISVSHEVLTLDGSCTWLKASIVSNLITYFSIDINNIKSAAALAHEYEYLIDELGKNGSEKEAKSNLINNIVFAYIENGQISDAVRLSVKLAAAVHSHPFATATFGLLQIKRGNLARGQKLYHEAIKLAHSRSDKSRFRQKLNLELGAALASSDPKKARRFLVKAIGSHNGVLAFEARGREIMLSLPRPDVNF